MVVAVLIAHYSFLARAMTAASDAAAIRIAVVLAIRPPLSGFLMDA
jgi:hypothetical protein